MAINETLNDSRRRNLFSLNATKPQTWERTRPELKNVTFHFLGGTVPQLWDRFIWLTQDYEHLGTKAPLCGE